MVTDDGDDDDSKGIFFTSTEEGHGDDAGQEGWQRLDEQKLTGAFSEFAATQACLEDE